MTIVAWQPIASADILKTLSSLGYIKNGADASKAASPAVGEIYVATDTKKFYFCSVAGKWINVPSSLASRLSHEESTTTLSNAQTAAAVVTTTIAANTIGATGALEWNVYGDFTTPGGASQGIGVSFGGSAVFTGTSGNINDIACRWHLRLKIVNTATNAQRCFFEFIQEYAKGTKADMFGEYTALSIDTTANKDLAMTWTTNGNPETFHKYMSDVILLP